MSLLLALLDDGVGSKYCKVSGGLGALNCNRVQVGGVGSPKLKGFSALFVG